MNIQKNIELAPFTTFHIGGPADYFVVAKIPEEIIEAVRWAKQKNVPFFVLGQGANILVGDRGYRGLVVKNEANKFEISRDGRQDPGIFFLNVESGATIEQLITFSLEHELSGFEHFAGIPSSVGGALWQNLHFLNPDRTDTVFIGDLLQEAVILGVGQSEAKETASLRSQEETTPESDSGQARMTVKKDYFNFSYDYSILHDSHDVILSATFKLTKKPKEDIQKVIEANIKWRQEKHPKNAEHSSAGSVFKKIEHHGAGRLIEQVGLKGKKIGGAQISKTHANFIINTGNAKASDVMQLIALIQTKIKEELGLDMTPEISFVGEF